MSEKTKNVMLGVLIVGLVAMTVAYAALSTTLRISGTASIESNVTWDVHFANWQKYDGASGLASTVLNQQNTSTASTPTVTHGTAVDGLQITLKQPGDNIKYEFDIVNAGTIDAKLNGNAVISLDSAESVTGSTGINDEVITYNVVCDANQGVLLKASETPNTTHCTLTVKYNESITNQNQNTPGADQTYTQGQKTVTLGASWNYVQK